MKKTGNDQAALEKFRSALLAEERSPATVEKYIRDARGFLTFAAGGELTKDLALSYKARLIESGYSPRSVNSVLAALNRFFVFLGRNEWKLRALKIQKKLFCSEEKELTRAEYERLVKAAEKKNNARLSLLLQTICATGIRVSELCFITVEAAKKGYAVVSNKGKTRKIFLVRSLQKRLTEYAKRQKIEKGSIFVTNSGKPLSRTNIWRDMKSLCASARVLPEKVCPHNLRHLFARVFYGLEKDIAKLADILGHSSIDTTRIYIVSTGEEHRRRMENMRLIL